MTWAWVAWAWVAWAGLAGGAGAAPVPVPASESAKWLPVPRPRQGDDVAEPIEDPPASAFPALAPPDPKATTPGTPEWVKALAKRSPRLLLVERMEHDRPVVFKPSLPPQLQVEAGDDTPRQLLKARLTAGVRENTLHVCAESYLNPRGEWVPPVGPPCDCLADVRATARELWAGWPDELAAWLEECVVAAKERERVVRRQAADGRRPYHHLNCAVRHRLAAEAALWAVRNPPQPPKADPPAKTAGAKLVEPKADDLLGGPTAFPELMLPPPDRNNPKWLEAREAKYAELCPRLSGGHGLKIEPGDDTGRKLLKARIHQAVLEMMRHRKALQTEGPTADSLHKDCVDDLLAAVLELYADRPKERAPWLEQLVIDAKDWERTVRMRVEAGALRPAQQDQATRQRLRVEAELWKVKSAK